MLCTRRIPPISWGKKLPIEEQYIHSVVNSHENGILILHSTIHLIQLISQTTSFEVTQHQRAHGELNEWELVIWYAGENRCTSIQSSWLPHFSHSSPVITIGRCLRQSSWSELITSSYLTTPSIRRSSHQKPMHFKRAYHVEVHFWSMNVDSRGSASSRGRDSFLKTTEPEYSGIETNTQRRWWNILQRHVIHMWEVMPSSIASSGVYLHCIRAIHDFKDLVSRLRYRCIIDFRTWSHRWRLLSLRNSLAIVGHKESPSAPKISFVQSNHCWCPQMGNHKLQHSGICAINYQIMLVYLPHHWMQCHHNKRGESQHHWTNTQTAPGLHCLRR